jgi:hypothetical protein
MGTMVIPTGLEDMPVVLVKTPYVEQTKHRRKIIRNLEVMMNGYLRDLIIKRSSKVSSGAAIPVKSNPVGAKHEHNKGVCGKPFGG